jgi:hypothetical protein
MSIGMAYDKRNGGWLMRVIITLILLFVGSETVLAKTIDCSMGVTMRCGIHPVKLRCGNIDVATDPEVFKSLPEGTHFDVDLDKFGKKLFPDQDCQDNKVVQPIKCGWVSPFPNNPSGRAGVFGIQQDKDYNDPNKCGSGTLLKSTMICGGYIQCLGDTTQKMYGCPRTGVIGGPLACPTADDCMAQDKIHSEPLADSAKSQLGYPNPIVKIYGKPGDGVCLTTAVNPANSTLESLVCPIRDGNCINFAKCEVDSCVTTSEGTPTIYPYAGYAVGGVHPPDEKQKSDESTK